MAGYAYADGVFTFEGAVSVETDGARCAPWRIPHETRDFYPTLKDGVARASSGVRLVFTTDSSGLSIALPESMPAMRLDLYVDGEFVETVSAGEGARSVEFQPLAAGDKDVVIWLPTGVQFAMERLVVDDGSTVSKTAAAAPRWVHYGSSISHANAAHSPSRTWPAITARRLGLHLTSLGFSGNCVLETMMARLIRDLPADYITLKLGINCHGGALSARTFGPAAAGLVQTVREKHPVTPIAVVSPIISPPREDTKGGSGLTLNEMRGILAGVVDACRSYGDSNVHYVDGRKVFGEPELEFLPDELHPSGDGQAPMAENFVREVFGIIGN
ncbi:MAG: GDSL family lipase [Planctomycetes bacterium]|nr:GDSL family lipase [Planctomycetota bacterium]